jgi:hypothetical protein
MLDIWYNFFGPHRPKLALWGLILLGLLTSLNAAHDMSTFGAFWQWAIFLVGCSMWFILLPCIIFLVDAKHGHTKVRPKR